MVFWSLLSSNWTFLFAISLLLYKWSVSTFDHFSNRKVPNDKCYPFIGTLKGLLFFTDSFSDIISKQYEKYKDHKYFGFYSLRYPILIVKDPDIIRQIFVEKFDHFINHPSIFRNSNQPLLGEMIQILENEKWKNMRETLTPAFSTDKIRLLFYVIEEYCSILMKHLKDKKEPNQTLEIDINDIFNRFSNDVIAAVVFGIKVDSLTNRDNELYRRAKEAVTISQLFLVKLFLHGCFKRIMEFFGSSLFSKEFTLYFQTLVLDTIRYRSENNITRFDMIQLLMEASSNYLKKTKISSKYFPNKSKTENLEGVHRNWSDNDIVAQCLSFFVGGLTKNSNLICFTILELANNPNVQNKLLEEIDQVKDRLNGRSVSFEELSNMKYLDMVLCEVLRKSPPKAHLARNCTKPYLILDNFKGHSLQLNVGDTVWIPIKCLHLDPEYFPDPHKFDPERFSEENRGFIKPYTYLPFGAGPRNCLCSKFALMQCKAVLFNLLTEFRIDKFSKRAGPIELHRGEFIYSYNKIHNLRIKLISRF